MTSIAIVVAAYRAEKTIGRTVDSLRACHGIERARMLIVDDGSDDDTVAQAEFAGHAEAEPLRGKAEPLRGKAEPLRGKAGRLEGPDSERAGGPSASQPLSLSASPLGRSAFRVLRLTHVGRPAALNAGIRAAEGAEVVLFTDADCVVPPSWIDDALAELGNFDGVGGNLLPGARTAVEWAKVLRYIHEFEFDFELRPTYANACLNGNNMAIRRAALLAVGGFDERFLHGADADLTRRLLAAGYRLRRTTKLQTTHLKVETLGQFLRTMHRRGSTVRFGMKNGEENAGTLARALLLSPWKWFFIDAIRAPRLDVVFGNTRGEGIQNTEYRRQNSGDRIQETEFRRQNTGDRIQETEVRRQNTRDGIQETEVRRQNTRDGIQETEVRRKNTGDGIQETEYRRKNTGDGIQETEYRRKNREDGIRKTGKRGLISGVPFLFHSVSCLLYSVFSARFSAPVVNLLGGIANALGRIHYYRRFKRESA